jgi:magnesium transporter
VRWYRNVGPLGASRQARKGPTTAGQQGQDDLRVEEITWGGLRWINIEKPTRAETDHLAQNFPFHPLDLDDCLSRIQRPKIDEYDEYLFIVFHFPLFRKEAEVTVASQLSIFIGKTYLITLHDGALKPLVKLFRDCQTSEQSCQANMKSSGYLLYRITDILVDYCLPITNKIMHNLEMVEDEIFNPRGHRGVVREISNLRRDVISNRRIIWSMKGVISSLEYRTGRYTAEDMEVFWGDVVDHVDKLWDTLDECKEIIEGLKDTNDSISSHHTNETMRVLTVIATIMMPLTLVASIYGMNVGLPNVGDESSLVSFIIIITIMVVVIGGMLLFFRSRRWI